MRDTYCVAGTTKKVVREVNQIVEKIRSSRVSLVFLEFLVVKHPIMAVKLIRASVILYPFSIKGTAIKN